MHIITIQDTFLDVVREVESGKPTLESIWIARRNSENEDRQEFFSVLVLLNQGKLTFTAHDENTHKIELSKENSHQFTAAVIDESGKHNYQLVFPQLKLNLGLLRAKISTCAISPDGDRLMVGTTAGDILHYDSSSAQLTGEVKSAHYSDITQISVLPSSQVIMSVGADLQVKLWALGATILALPVRTFLEQKGQITDLALIDRGRNFLTASLDGSVALWECSTAHTVSIFRLRDPVTCMALTQGEPVSALDIVGGNFLFGCEDKYVFVGCKLGTIQEYSVAGHFQTKARIDRASAVTLLCAEGPYLIAGYADGLLRVYDIDSLRENAHNRALYWDLQLNRNFAIEQAGVLRSAGMSLNLSLVVSNGPELLLRVCFDGNSFQYRQLVGLSEMFRIVLIGQSKDTVFVATESDIIQF